MERNLGEEIMEGYSLKAQVAKACVIDFYSEKKNLNLQHLTQMTISILEAIKVNV